jgi:hypothetical protein
MGEVRITPQRQPARVGDRRAPDPEDGTGVEFPVRAPMEGTAIVSRQTPDGRGRSTAESRAKGNRGVKVVSTNSAKRKPSDEGVKIINKDSKP